jgi:hypothetical protein
MVLNRNVRKICTLARGRSKRGFPPPWSRPEAPKLAVGFAVEWAPGRSQGGRAGYDAARRHSLHGHTMY